MDLKKQLDNQKQEWLHKRDLPTEAPTGDYSALPATLLAAIHNTFVAVHKPEKKDFRTAKN